MAFSAQLLKLIPDDSAVILKSIFQQFLDSGNVPNDWKHALVTPIHKKDLKSSIGNYRPISLTCVSFKLLVNEHILCNHIIKNLSTNNLLSPFQHGFKIFQSCESYDYQYPRSCFCLKWQAPIRCGSGLPCSWIFLRLQLRLLILSLITRGYLPSWCTMVPGANYCLGSKVF